MTKNRVKTLVLAGTVEGRAVIDALVVDQRFDITASLAGATPNPAALPVPTVNGGFGGADGLASWCRDHAIDLLVDVTHPFARQISRNARLAAASAGVQLLRFERPPWRPVPGDDWRSFTSWQDMADAIPRGSRSNVTFINALPAASVEVERARFAAADISLLCCKNSGGDASFAKIAAARELGLPVWLLARHSDEAGKGQAASQIRKPLENLQIHDSVETLIAAARLQADR